jgi:hypothetical protein
MAVMNMTRLLAEQEQFEGGALTPANPGKISVH